jgi:NADP-dependent alcohol dehydrogenase
MTYLRSQKCAKLLQYGERVWGIRNGDDDLRANTAIHITAEFFRSVGVPTMLKDYGIGAEAAKTVGQRFAQRGTRLGERREIAAQDVEAILALC